MNINNKVLILPQDIGKYMYNIIMGIYCEIIGCDENGNFILKHPISNCTYYVDCRGVQYHHTNSYKANPTFIWDAPDNNILDFWKLPKKDQSNPIAESKPISLFIPELNLTKDDIDKYMFDIINNMYVKILDVYLENGYLNIKVVLADGHRLKDKGANIETIQHYNGMYFPRLLWNKPNISYDTHSMVGRKNIQQYYIDWTKLPTEVMRITDDDIIHKCNFNCALELQDYTHMLRILY